MTLAFRNDLRHFLSTWFRAPAKRAGHYVLDVLDRPGVCQVCVTDRRSDELASLLRDALEASGNGWVEVRAEEGYATTVDGAFDLAHAAHRFLEGIEHREPAAHPPTGRTSGNSD